MIYKHILNKLRVLLPFTLLLFCTLLFVFSKGTIVLALNKLHSPFLNLFFKTLSTCGNALSVFVFLLITLQYKLKYVYFFLLAFLIESVVVILCKHVFFDGYQRPYLFFQQLELLHHINFVEGVKIRKYDSFPSGHTAYSFVIAVFFSLKFNRVLISSLLFIVAVLIGISRMYLVQHFFQDVYTGALLGVLTSVIAFFIVFSTEKKWYNYKLELKKNNKLIAFTNN